MRVKRWCLGLIAIVLASGVSAAEPSAKELIPFENEYSARLYGFGVKVTSSLKPKGGNRYEVYFGASAMVGDVTEISEFEWNPHEQLARPQHYFYTRTGLGKNRREDLQFDWTNNQVTSSARKTTEALDPAKKIQDSLSYQIQLRQDLMAGKNNLVYAITNGKKTKQYRFEVVGEETLDTPLGKVATLKVRRKEDNGDREIYAWFAKDFQYLLIRLQQEENGSAYTIYLSKASLNGKAIEHF
jgi:hypothetical protein